VPLTGVVGVAVAAVVAGEADDGGMDDGGADDGGVADGTGLADPEQPAATRTSSRTSAPARR
jgi:hypothetical protein